MRSLRNQLILAFATVVVTAAGVVFLYVVPSLQQNLLSERTSRLQAVAAVQRQNRALVTQFRTNHLSPRSLVRIGREAGAGITVYRETPAGITPVAGVNTSGIGPASPLVRRVLRGAGVVTGRGPGGSIVVAFGMPGGVVVLDQPVTEVSATANLVERRIVIAAVLALVVATAVGWAAAVTVTRRLGALEAAARRIAAGEFDQPIGDQSPDELGRLGRAFDLMQSRLSQVDRARKDFIANASHELRTPLFSLGGFLELLGDEDLDEDTRAEFLETMREQVTRLTKLATDLLDLSRLDAGAVAIAREPIDMRASARSLVREFRGLAARHGSRVVLARGDGGAVAVGDEQRVQQIGRVLLDNAVRHNPEGTQVRVAVERRDGLVALVVSDDGPGLDPSVREHLFERFVRGEGAAGSGSGLGLAIARELAQRMGGTLTVGSDSGETSFRLELPAEEPAPAGAPVPA
jgi:signal transduction histidine kinase